MTIDDMNLNYLIYPYTKCISQKTIEAPSKLMVYSIFSGAYKIASDTSQKWSEHDIFEWDVTF
jgi:hypothetical protein